MNDEELEQRIDALYGAPPESFVAERNRLAKEVSGAARTRVKALAKPTLIAYLLNQLYRRHRDHFGQLFAAGDALIAAQANLMKGMMGQQAMTEAVAGERVAIDQLVDEAIALAEQAGHPVTAAMREHLATSLRALARMPTTRAAFDGRLARELGPIGFEALSVGGEIGSVGAATPTAHPAHISAADRAKDEARAREQEKARQEERRRREAIVGQRRVVDERIRVLRQLEGELSQAEHREQAMKERGEAAERALAQARADLEEASSAAQRARREVDSARAEAEAATTKLAELEKPLLA